ncbi:MAG: TetR/AcrR family transcriptional regulator [Proteobacteria bacterium]|nr:TetR/AcrR family transcriptional regulator [Pseudomonadota bacterium]
MTTPTMQRRGRTPQNERVEATQRKIIDSALNLLRQEGLRGTTLQAVARGADVSLGALQHHFESRDALMERLVDEVMEPLGDQGSVWPDTALPLQERAEEFVSRAWRHIFGAPNYLAAWSLFFGCKAMPTLFGRIDAHRGDVDRTFYARFLDTFPELRANHPNPQGFAVLVFDSLRGAGMLELFTVDRAEKESGMQALAELIAHACGVGAQGAERPALRRAQG